MKPIQVRDAKREDMEHVIKLIRGLAINCRDSKRDDMQHVMKMITDLADFENMPKSVKISKEDLERDGFDISPPLFSCYVAETSNSEIVGYALYYNTYSTWLGRAVFLEDLYVMSEYRKMGVGKKLFLAVAKKAYLAQTRLDFQVLAWNPAMEFYKKLGAENLTQTENWNSVRLNRTALNNLFEGKMES